MPVHGPQSRCWNEERVARELERWFAECAFDCWPTYRTFVRRGHKRLHAALMHSGGPARWALELGVPLPKHPSGPGLSNAAIELALRDLLREHRPVRLPTNAWLARHGPPALAAAVRRTGGRAHWARVLNVPAPQPARWTDELIEAELRRVCMGQTSWPTPAEFARASATGVLRAVYRGHGSRWWAGRPGLVKPTVCGNVVAGTDRRTRHKNRGMRFTAAIAAPMTANDGAQRQGEHSVATALSASISRGSWRSRLEGRSCSGQGAHGASRRDPGSIGRGR